MTENMDRDGLLGMFVKLVDEDTSPDAATTVTLSIGGQVMAGDLIPQWVWFRRMREHMSGAGGRAAGGVVNAFGIMADDLLGVALVQEATSGGAGTDAPDGETSADPAPMPAFLHLANARLLGADHRHVQLPGGLWRARVSAVSGWTIGRLDG